LIIWAAVFLRTRRLLASLSFGSRGKEGLGEGETNGVLTSVMGFLGPELQVEEKTSKSFRYFGANADVAIS